MLNQSQSPRDKRKEPQWGWTRPSRENGLPFDLETLCGERLWLLSAVWVLTLGTPFSSLFYPLPSSSSHYCCQAPSFFTPTPSFLETRGCLRGWWCVLEVKKGPHRAGASHARFMLANPDKPRERAREGVAGWLFLNPQICSGHALWNSDQSFKPYTLCPRVWVRLVGGLWPPEGLLYCHPDRSNLGQGGGLGWK